jgi:hypothetical protein
MTGQAGPRRYRFTEPLPPESTMAPDSKLERVYCRTCDAETLHRTAGEPAQPCWVCVVCGALERRTPRPRSVEEADMRRLGIHRDRRQP